MPKVTTLDASDEFHTMRVTRSKYFETPPLIMSYMSTFATSDHVTFGALTGFMSNFITLKTHLFVAVEAIMSILSAQNAVVFLGFVWTFFGHVSKLSAIMTFDSWVFFTKITLTLCDLLELLECVIMVFRIYIHVRVFLV